MKNRKRKFIALLFVSAALLTAASVKGIRAATLDISRVSQNTGIVSAAGIRHIGRSSIRWRYHKRVFYFRLACCQQSFAIERTDGVYSDLESAIRIGDTLKIYYRPGKAEYNTALFQVEKGKTILAGYREYSRKNSREAGWALLLGTLLCAGSIIWYRRINLATAMLKLVDGKRADRRAS